MKPTFRFLLLLVFVATAGAARANDVTDWNTYLLQAGAVGGSSPIVMSRNAAIVHASVFDAVNGIDRHYTPIHVPQAAPKHASRRAAVIQAAYASLSKIYPDQQATFDAERAASLEALVHEKPDRIQKGIEWGQAVADAIWAWRLTDGLVPPPPPFLGGTGAGEWRPTPPFFLPGAAPQFATMVPWVMESPSQFRPAGPPALDSARYTSDFAETQLMGGLTSGARTSDQELFAEFWASDTVTYFWNTIAVALLQQRHRHGLLDNARLLARLNLAMADAVIACWDAKYHFDFWRPVTAIPLADTDGNPATAADPDWMPLLFTPFFPEYPSGHSTFSAAGATVLADRFGEDTPFTVGTDAMPGVTRSFANFSSALEEIKDARIVAGIHFRSACDDGQQTGVAVAEYVMANAMTRICKDDDD